eukprot:jgi/Tetstr1/440640/TSEL_028950.t1
MVNAMLPPILRENLDYLEQLQQSYCSPQDQEQLLDTMAVFDEVLGLCQRREEDVRGAIQGLAAQVASVKEAVHAAKSAGSVEERLRGLNEETARSREATSCMTAQERELRVAVQRLQQRLRATEAAKKAEAEGTADAMGRLRHQLSLYAHISRTAFEAHPTSGGLLASVSKPGSAGRRARGAGSGLVLALAWERWFGMGCATELVQFGLGWGME